MVSALHFRAIAGLFGAFVSGSKTPILEWSYIAIRLVGAWTGCKIGSIGIAAEVGSHFCGARDIMGRYGPLAVVAHN